MAVTTSDEELVGRMAAGDEQALVELYRRYAPCLTAMARRMLGDPDEADAGVRDAFANAWGAAGRFDPGELSAKTWLVTLTHRLVRHRVRERVPDPPAPNDRDGSPQPVGHSGRVGTSPSEGSATAEARDLLEHAFFQGLTYQDLAGQTGRPLEDVKQALRAALERLGGAPGEREL